MLNTKTEYNDPNFPGYDSSKTKTTTGMVDVNSLYPTVMVKKLPVGKPIDLTEEEMGAFMKDFEFARDNRDAILDKNNDLKPKFLNCVENDREKCAYALVVDYEIDNDAKYITDDLPLSIHNKIVKPEEVSG